MLETRFPRVVGDVGNAATWPFAVDFEIVRGVGAEAAVRELDPTRFEQQFIDAAQRLEARGARAIATSCGFLILLQERLQAAVAVPVLSSSLLQVPWIASLLGPQKKIAILTFERSALRQQHLAAARILPAHVVIAGLEETPFHATIAQDLETLDVQRARDDHVAIARRLLEEHPDAGAFVLECTNMPPYASAIREATGLPVYDVTTMVRSFAAGFTGTT